MRFFFAVTLLVCFFQSIKGTAMSSQAQVEVQWEADSAAKKYHIELNSLDGKFVKKFESKTSLFKFNVEPGKYKIRAQTETSASRLGPWSEWVDVNVPPKKVLFKEEKIKSKLVAQPGRLKTPVRLEWQEQPMATKYEVHVKNDKGVDVQVIETEKTESTAEFLPGKYFLEIVTVAKDGLKSKPAVLKTPIIIETARLPVPNIKPRLSDFGEIKALDVDRVEGVTYYVKTEKNLFLSTDWMFLDKAVLQESTWYPDKGLAPGHYRVSFWAEAPSWQTSDTSAWDFVVKPKESDLAFLNE